MTSSDFFSEIANSVSAQGNQIELASPFAKQRLSFLLWYTEQRSELEECSYTTQQLSQAGVDIDELARLRSERRVLGINVHGEYHYPCAQFIDQVSFQPAPELPEILEAIDTNDFQCYLWLSSAQAGLERVPLEMIQTRQGPALLSFLLLRQGK